MAIYSLCPDSEFTFTDQDYSTIEWIKLDGKAPTQSQIDAKIEEIKAKESSDLVKLEADRASATSKLESLGLTADDLKALGL